MTTKPSRARVLIVEKNAAFDFCTTISRHGGKIVSMAAAWAKARNGLTTFAAIAAEVRSAVRRLISRLVKSITISGR